MELEDKGKIDLLFADETGFNLVPCIPYGWQPIGERLTIRPSKDCICNMLGFLSRKGELKIYSTPHNINSNFVIECFDEIAEDIKRPTVLVLDNAPWHCSKMVKNKMKKRNEKYLYLFFLPTYSPQLNLIEIL